MTAFRVAVVGAGSISAQWLPLLRDHPDVEVVAVADVDGEAARGALARAGLDAPVFASLAAAAAAGPDVVVNLTPPDAHRAVVEEALALGCHVIGEKPIATTLADAHALIAAAARAGRTYAVMQNRRYDHGIRTLRSGVQQGRIGQIGIVSCDLFLAPHFGGFRERMESPLLLDMAIHLFDMARFVTGAEPVAVTCRELDPPGSWYDGAAAAICLFELDDGAVFSFRGSWCSAGFATSWNGSWRLSGSTGTAVWDGDGDPAGEVAVAPAGPELFHPTRSEPWRRAWHGPTGHAGCLDAVLNALARGEPPETDSTDNLRSFAMVVGARESARLGRRVELAELDAPGLIG